MAYSSPLQRLYEKSTREDHRYSPYKRTSEQGQVAHRDHQRSHNSSNKDQGPGPSSVVRYSDRFKPAQYPKELTKQFEAMTCKLCAVDFTSPIVGKMHYSGKPHARKIKLFLTGWSHKTGLPIPDVGSNPKPSGESMAEYCELCNVSLTSTNDKLLHYSGKLHRKNESDPNNARKKNKACSTIDAQRFGIGVSFFKEEPGTEVVEISSSALECKLCDVKTTSQEQMAIHLTGKKHKEKVAKKQSGTADDEKPEKKFVCDTCNLALETQKLYNLHCDGKRHKKNLMKKCPGGSADFCDVCKVKYTSIHHYHDHIQGKKHEKMMQKAVMLGKKETVQDEKFPVACQYCTFVGDVEGHDCDKSLLKIDFATLHTDFMCPACNQFFDCEEEYKKHKESRRHLLCVLNQKSGDKIVEELKCFYCFVCKKQYSNSQVYTNHLFENRHTMLSAPSLEGNAELYECRVCDVVIDAVSKDGHLMDPKHLKNDIKKDYRTHLSNLANQKELASVYKCNCQQVFNNFRLYSEHLLSEKHIDMMVQKQINVYNRV